MQLTEIHVQEEAEKQLEAEMQKRRERIEKWRAEKKKKEFEITKKEAERGTISVPKGSTRAWNLEDDDDEEEGQGDKGGDKVRGGRSGEGWWIR